MVTDRNLVDPTDQKMTRRSFSAMMLSAAVLPIGDMASALRYPLYDAAAAQVIPRAGHLSKISLNDAIVKLVDGGAIDLGKFFQLYSPSGGYPAELRDVLTQPSDGKINLTSDNVNYYTNLLWPLGLSNHMAANTDSPINGDGLDSFASTAGWSLGQAENGAAYFDKLSIVPLTPEQEARVVAIAGSTYRPCCDNSTFFQDCNHGSALLGLLRLGVSQGLSDEELYREALAFNSFWFPDAYIQTALYFEVFNKVPWNRVDPRVIMGFDYSAIRAWQQNVAMPLATLPGLVPGTGGGTGCGV